MYNLANIDPTNQIRYSTIYGNDVSSSLLDDIISFGQDLTYEEALQELNSSIRDNLNEILTDHYINNKNKYIELAINDLMESVEDQFNNFYESDSSTYLYDHDGYQIEYHTSDNSLIILKSPYYTYSRLASPCFPNGCYLPDYDPTNGHKCYCLDNTFYSPDDPAPYQFIYNIETNKKEIMHSYQEE
jgi:hypothetical protein